MIGLLSCHPGGQKLIHRVKIQQDKALTSRHSSEGRAYVTLKQCFGSLQSIWIRVHGCPTKITNSFLNEVLEQDPV